ncbi:unnamed protein product [Paramecium primaurelia]|uniref:Uncharacterized protein n=1 Tax=Paramecium primaurelia TaxID=5886 RepID=A0A8S1LL65_PARPR|nr:unnamed protein product [Paramecium primaurelia]
MNRQEKQEVEQGLRNLLEEMMIFSNEKISGIEHCNCQDLIQRISKQFRQLKNSNLEYKKLEQVLQQQEADIRNHISLEQQMKLYQDGLQSKLEESNQEVKRLQQEIYKLKKSKYEQSMIVVNQNLRKRIRVMMDLLLIDKVLQKNNPPSHNMEVTLLIEVHVMNYLRDTINCYNNSRLLQVNDQIISRLVSI